MAADNLELSKHKYSESGKRTCEWVQRKLLKKLILLVAQANLEAFSEEIENFIIVDGDINAKIDRYQQSLLEWTITQTMTRRNTETTKNVIGMANILLELAKDNSDTLRHAMVHAMKVNSVNVCAQLYKKYNTRFTALAFATVLGSKEISGDLIIRFCKDNLNKDNSIAYTHNDSTTKHKNVLTMVMTLCQPVQKAEQVIAYMLKNNKAVSKMLTEAFLQIVVGSCSNNLEILLKLVLESPLDNESEISTMINVEYRYGRHCYTLVKHLMKNTEYQKCINNNDKVAILLKYGANIDWITPYLLDIQDNYSVKEFADDHYFKVVRAVLCSATKKIIDAQEPNQMILGKEKNQVKIEETISNITDKKLKTYLKAVKYWIQAKKDLKDGKDNQCKCTAVERFIRVFCGEEPFSILQENDGIYIKALTTGGLGGICGNAIQSALRENKKVLEQAAKRAKDMKEKPFNNDDGKEFDDVPRSCRGPGGTRS